MQKSWQNYLRTIERNPSIQHEQGVTNTPQTLAIIEVTQAVLFGTNLNPPFSVENEKTKQNKFPHNVLILSLSTLYRHSQTIHSSLMPLERELCPRLPICFRLPSISIATLPCSPWSCRSSRTTTPTKSAAPTYRARRLLPEPTARRARF